MFPANASGEFELNSPPKDGVSSVKFGNETDHLISSSWDSHLYLHDAVANRLKGRVPLEAALLDCCFGKSDALSYAGGLSRQVVQIDWNTLKVSILGTHDDAIRCLVRDTDTGVLFSGSWDSSITAWDPTSQARIARLALPTKVYTMDLREHTLIVGMAERHVHIFDTRKLGAALQTRESALRHQTRCIRLFPRAEAFTISSIEGRVGVEYVDVASQGRNFAFKCHRVLSPTDPNMELVYPVNAITFHPKRGTFCTGGSDGVVCAWDPEARKRLRAYPKYPSSISSLAFNRTGDMLAIASSYGYEEGEKDHAPDSIFIRTLEENEMQGKLVV